MVRLLAVEYAKPDESLILVTVSMTGKSLSEMWINYSRGTEYASRPHDRSGV